MTSWFVHSDHRMGGGEGGCCTISITSKLCCCANYTPIISMYLEQLSSSSSNDINSTEEHRCTDQHGRWTGVFRTGHAEAPHWVDQERWYGHSKRLLPDHRRKEPAHPRCPPDGRGDVPVHGVQPGRQCASRSSACGTTARWVFVNYICGVPAVWSCTISLSIEEPTKSLQMCPILLNF